MALGLGIQAGELNPYLDFTGVNSDSSFSLAHLLTDLSLQKIYSKCIIGYRSSRQTRG